METTILEEIIIDLADNYRDDEDVLRSLLEDTINDALFLSNRIKKQNREMQLSILKSNIKKAVKTIYLQRGSEDSSSTSQNGISNTYSNAIDIMKKDIISQNKRILY